MKYHACKQQKVSGELYRRLEANYNRLRQKEYSVEYICEMDKSDWPGDYRGRTLLALAQQTETMERGCEHLLKIADNTLKILTKKGYLGADVQAICVDEQQLAGHSWLLRALLACYRVTCKEAFLKASCRLFEELFNVVGAAFSAYPLQRERIAVGGPSGTLMGEERDGWRLSSDVGCAFIALDGLSEYYVVTKDDRARERFFDLYERFAEIDPVENQMQTHATLTALRGILRMYRCMGNHDLLRMVQERFEQYLDYGLTLNYANYNWYGRPEWTECCAVTDSLILCNELFKENGDAAYVEIGNRILYNGLMAGQRSNGGFGSDNCLTQDGKVHLLGTHPSCYEASWCCTMRGAEGLTQAAKNAVLKCGNEIYVLTWCAGEYDFGDAVLKIYGEYPLGCTVDVSVEGKEDEASLIVYRPEGCILHLESIENQLCFDQGTFVRFKVKSGEKCTIRFEADERICESGNLRLLWRGPMLYAKNGMPLAHRFYLPREILEKGIELAY